MTEVWGAPGLGGAGGSWGAPGGAGGSWWAPGVAGGLRVPFPQSPAAASPPGRVPESCRGGEAAEVAAHRPGDAGHLQPLQTGHGGRREHG